MAIFKKGSVNTIASNKILGVSTVKSPQLDQLPQMPQLPNSKNDIQPNIPTPTPTTTATPTIQVPQPLECTFLAGQANKVKIWTTSPDLALSLSEQNPTGFTNCKSDLPTIVIDDTKQYQRMVGFGASMTDTSAYLISRSTNKDELMNQLFDRQKGIGISFLRQPIGASDFTVTSPYSYDDVPSSKCPNKTIDADMECFSIEHDKAYILPLLKQAKTINPSLSFMASPWSPPAWMKNSHTMIGEGKNDKGTVGELSENAYAPYAKYLALYLTSYKDEGIPISYLSMQNEPDVFLNYPGMLFPAYAQKAFLRDYLAPELSRNNLSPKILIFDNSYFSKAPSNLQDFKEQVAGVPGITGTAIHCYGDFPLLSNVLGDMYETECSPTISQNYVPSKANPLTGIRMMIDAVNYGSKTIVMWNIAENQLNGPRPNNNSTGCSLCKPLVTLTTNAELMPLSSPKFEADYYALGHISKFVIPGAVRIFSTASSSLGIYNVAFKNPDGSKVLILFNNSQSVKSFQVSDHGNSFTYDISPKNIITFVWGN